MVQVFFFFFTGEIAKGKWMWWRGNGGSLQVGGKERKWERERKKGRGERRWMGGGLGVSEVQQHSLWDWNTSAQHHIPFHTEFFSPNRWNLSRLPYIKQTFSMMCTHAAGGGKHLKDFENKVLIFWEKGNKTFKIKAPFFSLKTP